MVDPAKTPEQIESETKDEIDQIMGEIDVLQQSMANAPTTAQATQSSAEPEEMTIEDFRGGADDASMEETLGNLAEEPASGGMLADAEEEIPEPTGDDAIEAELAAALAEQKEETVSVTELKPKSRSRSTNPEPASGGQEGTLTLSLTGSMTLKLRYECEGQEVTIGFSGDALRVELSDGTEFKVPVNRQKAA